jgi:hypothetical protein
MSSERVDVELEPAGAAILRVRYEDSSSPGKSRHGVVAVLRESGWGLIRAPTVAEIEKLRLAIHAHEEALTDLLDDLDWRRLNRTFAPLTAMVQALAGPTACL